MIRELEIPHLAFDYKIDERIKDLSQVDKEKYQEFIASQVASLNQLKQTVIDYLNSNPIQSMSIMFNSHGYFKNSVSFIVELNETESATILQHQIT